jgi:iron complex outermembrane receptor protein
VVTGTWAVPAGAHAQTPTRDLTQLSIEDLMNIEVTSVSRKEQRVLDVAAAIFVITQDDIRRSGMTTIPDLLRMVPGVNVAQLNAGRWAVSVRGFNSLYANKLQVLIDGRSVYNRMFSGVTWDSQDLMLDDIDRIEVIRGPGAATWGANAVNGVINIVTKDAGASQGGLVRVDAGRMGTQAAARYGGIAGRTQYRVFAQWTGREESLLAPGSGADDEGYSITTGFRADRPTTRGAFTLEGAFTAGRTRALWDNLNPDTAGIEPIVHDPSDTWGGHVLARWTHTRASGTSLQVQSFVDTSRRDEPVGLYSRKLVEVDAQVRRAFGARHDVVVGAGVRGVSETLDGRNGVSVTPANERSSLLTAFVNDDITLVADRLSLTLGSQIQHDSFAGFGVQPTARIMWKVHPRQRLWAAAGRALRTPSLTDRRIQVDMPPMPSMPAQNEIPLVVRFVGNPEARTERFTDLEVGYRLDLGRTASLDVTGFVGRYSRLVTTEIGPPEIRFVPAPQILLTTRRDNLLSATTRGAELAGHWAPAPTLRLDGSVTVFDYDPRLAPASTDPDAARHDARAPKTQWQARAAFTPSTRATFTAALFHVGKLRNLGVGAYTRADITGEWQWTDRVSIMAIGQNLLDAAHREFSGGEALLLATQMPRSIAVRLRWTFR